jgi:hypothetical protein
MVMVTLVDAEQGVTMLTALLSVLFVIFLFLAVSYLGFVLAITGGWSTHPVEPEAATAPVTRRAA